jgi:hypothetical protein
MNRIIIIDAWLKKLPTMRLLILAVMRCSSVQCLNVSGVLEDEDIIEHMSCTDEGNHSNG